MYKSLIVAVSDNNAIGRDNALLWHISDDLKYFKKVTMGSPVIMGRKTYASIGRPLPKRMNIVISRSVFDNAGVLLPEYREKQADNLIYAASLEEAWEKAACHIGESGECFVIGGGEIYRQSLPLVDKLYITRVHTVVGDADTFFPELDMKEWCQESASSVFTDLESGTDFEFVTYLRKHND